MRTHRTHRTHRTRHWWISVGRHLLPACVSLMLSLHPLLSQAQHAMPDTSPKPDIVLVHGAFADGSSWSAVIALLQRKGYHVTAVQHPLSSLADDVAATTRVIGRQAHDVLLVGHSWGGTVITEAGNHPRVRALVYLSALAPDSGESTAQLLERMGAPMQGLQADRHGLIWLDDPQVFGQVMANDIAVERVRRLAAVQQPIAAAAFGESVVHAAWHDKPVWYLVTQDDHALPAAVQRKIAAMLGARTETIRSAHLSPVSHPQEVAGLIERAARSLP